MTNDGESPLHLASLLGRVDAAHMLFEHGANVTAGTILGRLHYTVSGVASGHRSHAY
jgi:ankyrin repeat protein